MTLLSHTCKHPRYHEQIHWEHTQLPPSLGTVSQNCCYDYKGSDNLTPANVSITYRIVFRIFKTCKHGEPRTIGEWTQLIHIHSPRIEQPPLLITEDNILYRMSRRRFVTEGMRRRRIGHLSAHATQPAAIHYCPPSQTNSTSNKLTTNVRINFQYQTTSGRPLPDLRKGRLELNAITSFAVEPWSDYPNLMDQSDLNAHYAHYIKAVSVPSLSARKMLWKRDSVQDDGMLTEIYTGVLDLPIVLPDKTSFPPTFHSCLVSRTYSLRLELFFEPCSQWAASCKLSLTVPVQIC
jgi:hypothetical protein